MWWDIFTGIGALFGIFLFILKIYDSINSYLKISIKIVQNSSGQVSARTKIVNSSILSKKIKNAFLIISPENYDIINVGKILKDKLKLENDIQYTNDFEGINVNDSKYFDKKYGLIPLDFYTSEQFQIGDEELTYSVTIKKNELEKGCYSVRFFIFGKYRLHRVTQDLLCT